MYDFISGKICDKKTTKVVIENNGIGYAIIIPISTFDSIGAVGENCKLFLYYHVRENEIAFFGFHTIEEREIFKLLIKISGIGPKIAISILSGISVKNLFLAVTNQDIELLSTVPGIGKKSSQRIIVELKDKIDLLAHGELSTYSITKAEKQMISDAENALISLGYNRISVKKEIIKLMSEEKLLSSEKIVKKVINKLYQR
ncbi:MAG: Holliday junction branch migration protein RuvA [Candidatus Cloacimonetes bacterium]|nr:Holliday junction branch migration protein RuvA [Candidatus Cloacimonadota bacterium]MBL7108070.1 Holliday junction branch migration protein RuvA [Candidatus Cloacimonadota bacterium]